MQGLKEEIILAEKEFGKNNKLVQMMRAQERNQGNKKLKMYLTGSVPRSNLRTKSEPGNSTNL